MKIIHRKPSANFPQTATWGITATKYAVVIALGLHDVVIELPQRKLTQRALDVLPCGHTLEHEHMLIETGEFVCDQCGAIHQ